MIMIALYVRTIEKRRGFSDTRPKIQVSIKQHHSGLQHDFLGEHSFPSSLYLLTAWSSLTFSDKW